MHNKEFVTFCSCIVETTSPDVTADVCELFCELDNFKMIHQVECPLGFVEGDLIKKIDVALLKLFFHFIAFTYLKLFSLWAIAVFFILACHHTDHVGE